MTSSTIRYFRTNSKYETKCHLQSLNPSFFVDSIGEMAESAGTAESGPVFSPLLSSPSNYNRKKRQQEGIFSRFWTGLFGRNGGEDYEKSLRSLSKEEAAVQVRNKKRAQWWSNTATNIVIFSFSIEVSIHRLTMDTFPSFSPPIEIR